MKDNMGLLLASCGALFILLLGSWFALRKPSSGGTDTEAATAEATV